MFKAIRIAVASAVVGLGALAAMPSAAQANSFYFGITAGGPVFGYQAGPVRPGYGGHHRDWNRPARQACNAQQALRKADRMGIRRSHVRAQNHRVISVAGTNRGRPASVLFARAPNCPVIR